MIHEMLVLARNSTLELFPLPSKKKIARHKWIYYQSWTYDDTFSLMTKISTGKLFLPMVVIHHWSLHQLDIKSDFLHGDLEEKSYMENLLNLLL